MPAPDPVAAAPRLQPDFVAAWLDHLAATCGHRACFPFAELRSPLGQRQRVCAPFLSYAHLDAAGAQAAIASLAGGSGHVRHLAPLPADAAPGTPVDSVVPLTPWRDAEQFWTEGLSANLRKKIRKAAKDGWVVDRAATPAAVETFIGLYFATLQRHGTPLHPPALFHRLAAAGIGEVFTVRQGTSIAVCYFVIHDPAVSLFQWAGFNPAAPAGYASLLGEWEAFRAAFARGAHWFDLGRAPFDSASFHHKQYWHPQVFAATRTPVSAGSVYGKYRLASALWKRLPTGLARHLGPLVTRRLPDA